MGGGRRGGFFFLLFVLVLIVEAGAADDEESHEQKNAGDDGENYIHGSLKRFDGGEIDHAAGDDEYGDMHHHSVFFG